MVIGCYRSRPGRVDAGAGSAHQREEPIELDPVFGWKRSEKVVLHSPEGAVEPSKKRPTCRRYLELVAA